jgi:hypothetical protein
MNEIPMPNDADLNMLTEAAVGLHEMFKSLIGGGFTEQQALQLISAMILNAQNSPNE